MMQSVLVCRGCGRTIERDFIYCPWCGHSKINEDNTESFEEVFERLEKMQDASRGQQLVALQQQLDELASELNTLALSAEMHK